MLELGRCSSWESGCRGWICYIQFSPLIRAEYVTLVLLNLALIRGLQKCSWLSHAVAGTLDFPAFRQNWDFLPRLPLMPNLLPQFPSHGSLIQPSPPPNPPFLVWNPAEVNGSLDISSSKVRISPWVFIFFNHSQPVALSNFSRSQVQHFPLHYLCHSSMNSLQIKMLGAQSAQCCFRCCLSSNLMEILLFFFCQLRCVVCFSLFPPCFFGTSRCIFMPLIKMDKNTRPNSDLTMESTSSANSVLCWLPLLLFLPSNSCPSWAISIQANLNSSCVIWGDTKLEASSW